MPSPAELLPGTLDVLILKAVSLGKLHGYGILLRIELGYPERASEHRILTTQPGRTTLEHLGPVLSAQAGDQSDEAMLADAELILDGLHRLPGVGAQQDGSVAQGGEGGEAADEGRQARHRPEVLDALEILGGEHGLDGNALGRNPGLGALHALLGALPQGVT